MSIKNNYKNTLVASYLGYVNQAIINNFSPLLFVTFNSSFSISMLKISSLITINFMIQLFVDFISAFITDKIGYRASAVIAHISSFIGFILLGNLPFMMDDKYIALVISTVFLALGGGLCEVIISPIVEACPFDKKSASMSLLHSFYCWGQVCVVLITTLFFIVFGISNWRYMAMLWGLLPLLNSVYFSIVPINSLTPDGQGISIKELFKNKLFYLFLVLMTCSGASELAMSQWASTFAEAGLHISKTTGDLVGPTMFALFMGFSRLLYAKKSESIDLTKFIMISGLLCIICYIGTSFSPYPLLSLIFCALSGFTVGIMWPGTYSIASKTIPTGGTAMFSLLALAGDLGCTSGPTIVGLVSERFNSNLKTGFIVSTVFPFALVIGIFLLRKLKVTADEE